MAQVDSYIGIFGTTAEFRVNAYKFKKYKGNRPPKEEFVKKWEEIIESYCIEDLGFVKVNGMEADDAIGFLMKRSGKYCCASPDKDMLQLPGWHLQVRDKKMEDGTERLSGTLRDISLLDAQRTFWTQMLEGDTSDNVAGVPGLGEKKAKEKLKNAWDDPIQMGIDVASAYDSYFGPYYGPIIYQETLVALQMGDPAYIEPLLREQFGDQKITRHISEIPDAEDAFHIPFPDFE